VLDNKVTKVGTLLFLDGKIYIDGWELADPGMCREHVIFACLYVAAELQNAALVDIHGAPDRDSNTVADMPRETPREWLCESTREFLEGFDAIETCEHEFAPCSDIPTHVACVKCGLCQRNHASCNCPAKQGEDCPLTLAECGARITLGKGESL
jgi:hypothetical protein